MTHTDQQWEGWLTELAENDFVIVDDFISASMYENIMGFFREAEKENQLKKAGIGASGELQVKEDVRGDFIYWLNRTRDEKLSGFFTLMDELRQQLLQTCYLSLKDAEFHIAKYPAGSFYEKHLDQFSGRANRQITVLIYLNPDWKKGNGGELKMYRDSGDLLIEPIARRLLLFKSDVVEHEVLTTHTDRYSLTGWLLHQPAEIGSIFS